MLLDDKRKLVEVYMENVLWGNVTLRAINQESGFGSTAAERTGFKSAMQLWCSLRAQKQTDAKKFKELTEKLHDKIVDFRIVGLIIGKFEDPDATITTLKHDNKKRNCSRDIGTFFTPDPSI